MVSINGMNKYTRMHANPINSQFNNTPLLFIHTIISMTNRVSHVFRLKTSLVLYSH
jgi:hypothetical protein